MSAHTLIGIDPGIVHTGVVVLRIDTRVRQLTVEDFVIGGDDSHAEQVKTLLKDLAYDTGHIFIESYRERGNRFSTDSKMRELLSDFRTALPKAKVIDNTGVKKVVGKPLLRALGLTDFPTTHHQDLESAARILVYGALKDERLNDLLTRIVTDHVEGNPWVV